MVTGTKPAGIALRETNRVEETMGCILNYCSGHVAADLLVIAYYLTGVLAAVGLSYIAGSKLIRTAASLVGICWAFGLFSYLYLNVASYYLIAVMLDTILAYQFWRIGKKSFFAAPLFYLIMFEIAFIVLAQGAGLSTYATLFVLNRIFELTLLYLIGCSLFRLHVLRLQKNSKEPITDWRVCFVAG